MAADFSSLDVCGLDESSRSILFQRKKIEIELVLPVEKATRLLADGHLAEGHLANATFVQLSRDAVICGLYYKNIRIVRMTIVRDAPSCGVTYDRHSDN